MSIAGILSSSLFSANSQTVTSPQQQFQKEFQQLGKDLQSGNISAAQADFVTLQQYTPQSNAPSSSSQSSNPIVQAFNQLSKDRQPFFIRHAAFEIVSKKNYSSWAQGGEQSLVMLCERYGLLQTN